MSRRRWLAGTLIAAVCGPLLVLFPRLFERVEEVEDRGYRGEAAIHPYFALKELFQYLGIPTRSLSSLRHLPPKDHVLWIAAPSRGSDPGRVLAWAAGGGHLVVTPAGAAGEDPLLQALGVQRFGAAEADEDDHLSRPDFATGRPDWPLLTAAEDVEVLRAEGAADAAWTLTVAVGDGAATVLNDGAFLHNDALGEHDHALVAWTVANLRGPPAGLWLVYRDPRPSLWALMTARAGPLAVSLAVLAAAALIFLTRRFGPLLEPVPRDRRQLAEHVRAVGDYLWGVGCEDALLAAQRQDLGRRLGRGLQPADDALDELALRSAAAAGVAEERVREALAAREAREPQTFTRIVHTLETLRRAS